MKKTFFVEQPPFTEKHRFLVDDMSDNGLFGFTTDFNKVQYNFDIIGVDTKLSIDIRMPLAKDGITSIFRLGNFIVISEINKEETSGNMMFFDFDININLIENTIKSQYSERILKEFIKVQSLISASFDEGLDCIELFRPLES